ncbi:non-ribosomal peptide synthetase [Penicillium taxi]|uniref:non-ribosomal peptide synthetase n=1 Tax=Penicillium taxi TaxID=168475 RepID=UPI0025450759|nr:non-ribosomal peptide synthetase [Penicillium taxi]KAJ5909260.1 non-ribosomal peptide synthetase [Penicillium taxi]
MKAGRPFLLLDSGHPTQPLREICQLVGPPVLLSSKSLASSAALLAPVVIITVDADAASWNKRQICALDSPVKRTIVTPDDCFYVVFTSGSSGQPNGIVISHRAFSSMTMAYSCTMGVGPNTRAFSFASYAFDVSITDILDLLITGGCVCVPSSIDRIGNLAEVISRLRANFIEITPPMLRTVRPEEVPSLETVVAYGPAECCPNSTVRTKLTVNSDPSSIGVGAGYWLWIVDPTDCERLAPIGAVGELLVEGLIVGSGYLNNPENTATSFVQSPRWANVSPSGSMQSRFYKTDDLVRYDEDGGQRVQIAEIEYYLTQLFPLAAGSAVELFRSKTQNPQEPVAFIFCGDDIRKRPSTKDPASLLPLLGTELRSPSASATVIELQEPISGFQTINPTNSTALFLNKNILSRVRSETGTGLIDWGFPLSMLGLDSIQLIIIVTFICNEFSVEVAVATLYDPKLTVTGLAEMISSFQQGQNCGAEVLLPVVDLSREIKDVYHQFNRQSKTLRLRKGVFLTGATGLLGSQILRQLLDDPSVDKVVVHVRAPTVAEALKPVVSTATLAQWWYSSYIDRIECVSGDLSAPRSFTFISGRLQRAPTQDIQSFMEVLQQSNGYSQTKFVAVELVSIFASRQSKNNISIVRPGLIIGTEKGIPNIDDFQWKFVQVCLRMGSYPMEEGNLWLCMADVEEVVTTTCNSAFETAQQNAATPSVMDVETGSTVSQFWDMVQETTGIREGVGKMFFLESDDVFRPLLAILQDSQQGLGLHKPEDAKSLRPQVIKRNVQTLVDIEFLSTAHSPGRFNLSGLIKAGVMAAFNRSRRQ